MKCERRQIESHIYIWSMDTCPPSVTCLEFGTKQKWLKIYSEVKHQKVDIRWASFVHCLLSHYYLLHRTRHNISQFSAARTNKAHKMLWKMDHLLVKQTPTDIGDIFAGKLKIILEEWYYRIYNVDVIKLDHQQCYPLTSGWSPILTNRQRIKFLWMFLTVLSFILVCPSPKSKQAF